MRKKPFISVAMTTYNGEKYLEMQLQSLKDQIRKPDELVVFDDGSKDQSVNILEKFKNEVEFNVKIFRSLENKGLLYAFNYSLTKTLGDLVFVCDQDDFWFSTKIQKIEKQYINSNAHLFINNFYYTDQELVNSKVTGLDVVIDTLNSSFYFMAGSSTSITRDFLNFVLPFPQKNIPQYDIYMHRWANLLNTKIIIKEPLQYWRRHENNLSISDTSNPYFINSLKRFKKYKSIQTKNSYIDKYNEYFQMEKIINLKINQLNAFVEKNKIILVKKEIKKIYKAFKNRNLNLNKNRILRFFLVLYRYIKGDYIFFEGYKSLIKDIIRN